MLGDRRDAEPYRKKKNCTVMSASCVGVCDICGVGVLGLEL